MLAKLFGRGGIARAKIFNVYGAQFRNFCLDALARTAQANVTGLPNQGLQIKRGRARARQGVTD